MIDLQAIMQQLQTIQAAKSTQTPLQVPQAAKKKGGCKGCGK